MFLELDNQFALRKRPVINYEETCISRASDTTHQILYSPGFSFLIRGKIIQ